MNRSAEPMPVFYSDTFALPLPPEHRFPIAKYAGLREAVAAAPWAAAVELRLAPAATDEELTRAHTPDWVGRVQRGELRADEVRRIGFPWSPELVERERRSVGGTVAAAAAARRRGIAVNLAGGTHHAFADRGEGFCLFNDAVVAARAARHGGWARRALIIDCDVHQGNGTAALAAGDPTLFALSLHGRRNYPFHKVPSDLDVELDDGTTDADYLSALEGALWTAFDYGQPELALYLAGADPWEGDRLGRLALTREGLRRRDRLVLATCRERGVPVAVAMAGGYAPAVADIVALHLQTIEEAVNLLRGGLR